MDSKYIKYKQKYLEYKKTIQNGSGILLNIEHVLNSNQIIKYGINCGYVGELSERNIWLKSNDINYKNYLFKLKSCTEDANGLYYITIILIDDYIHEKLPKSYIAMTSEQIVRYGINCGHGGLLSGHYVWLKSDDVKYKKYLFKLTSCIKDEYGFYYVTIININNYINTNMPKLYIAMSDKQISKYKINCLHGSVSYGHDVWLKSDRHKYKNYLFKLNSCSKDMLGFYYVMIIRYIF